MKSTDKSSLTIVQMNDTHAYFDLHPFVCHEPAALVNLKEPKGDPLVKDKELTGFSNSEEEAVKLTKVTDGLLITGKTLL